MSTLVYEIGILITMCAASYVAASLVLSLMSGVLGYLLAYCAALGAGIVANHMIYIGERSVLFIAREIKALRRQPFMVARFYA